MPIARYAVVVGATLLALLVAVDWYFADGLTGCSTLPVEYAPALPQAEDFNIPADSDRYWTEKLLGEGKLPQ